MKFPYEDPQTSAPIGYCEICGGELYGDEHEICGECEAAIDSAQTVIDYMDAFPKRIKRFLEVYEDEEYMERFFEDARDFFNAPADGCPGIEDWARS